MTTTFTITAAILGGIGIVLSRLGHNNLSICFGALFVTFSFFALFAHRHETSKKLIPKNSKEKTCSFNPLELTIDHVSILKVFREKDSELISVPDINSETGIEIIVINTILSDLKNHELILQTNLDEFNGGWLYKLTDKGRKTALKFT